jgi:predicted RNase H-like HicB family nuclease
MPLKKSGEKKMKKLKYRILIQWPDEDNCYLVSLPDFLGQKWRTHGNTYAEAVKNAEEVLESLIQLDQKLGESLPHPEITKKREILLK